MRKKKKKKETWMKAMGKGEKKNGYSKFDSLDIKWLDSLDLAFAKGQLSWAGRW